MTCVCGCNKVAGPVPVGFGALSLPPVGSLNCGYMVNGRVTWKGYAPGATPAKGYSVCYISDGQNWLNYNAKLSPWDQLPVVNVSASAFNNLFKNFTQKASVAWRQQSLQGNQLNAQSVGITLNNLALTKGGNNTFQYTGPAAYAASMGSLAGLAWALSKGWLVITKQAAAVIQSNDQSSGVIPASFWEMYGKPIAIMASIVGGAAAIGGASAAGGAGSAGAGAGAGAGTTLAPTTASVYTASQQAAITAAESGAGLSTVSTTAIPIGGSGLSLLSGGGGIGSVLSDAGTVAGVAGGAAKTLATLQSLKNSAPGGSIPQSTVAPATSKSTLLPLLLLGGGAAVVALHFL